MINIIFVVVSSHGTCQAELQVFIEEQMIKMTKHSSAEQTDGGGVAEIHNQYKTVLTKKVWYR